MNRFIPRNLSLRIIALIFAVVIWFYVTQDEGFTLDFFLFRNPRREISVEIEAINIPKTDFRVSIEPAEVRVTLRDQSPGNGLDTATVRTFVDLEGKEEGVYTLEVFTALSDPAILERFAPREVLVVVSPRQ